MLINKNIKTESANDGWNDEIAEMSVFSKLEKLIYELKMAQKGVYTGAKTYNELASYIRDISSQLEAAADEVEDMSDEESMTESVNWTKDNHHSVDRYGDSVIDDLSSIDLYMKEHNLDKYYVTFDNDEVDLVDNAIKTLPPTLSYKIVKKAVSPDNEDPHDGYIELTPNDVVSQAESVIKSLNEAIELVPIKDDIKVESFRTSKKK